MTEHARSAPEPARVFAWLRVGAVPLVALSEKTFIRDTDGVRPSFLIAVSAFAVYALVTLLWRDPGPRRLDLYTGIDVLFSGILSLASGGGLSNLRFLSVIVLVSTIFRRRPSLTAGASVAAVVLYVLQAAAVHVARGAGADERSILTVQAGYLVSMGSAATALTYVLAQHEERIARLLAARQRLVVEALTAEERERQRVAEEIHDLAIQHLLAARHDLEESADADPGGPVARAYVALTETVGSLRSTMADLHPHLLDTVGLVPALTAAADRAAERAGFAVVFEGAIEPGGGNDRLIMRAVTELVGNAAKHAAARTVCITLASTADRDVATVVDDGSGFDPNTLEARVRDGHIGLMSIGERADVLGGALTISSAPLGGTQVTLSVPRHPARLIG